MTPIERKPIKSAEAIRELALAIKELARQYQPPDPPTTTVRQLRNRSQARFEVILGGRRAA